MWQPFAEPAIPSIDEIPLTFDDLPDPETVTFSRQEVTTLRALLEQVEDEPDIIAHDNAVAELRRLLDDGVNAEKERRYWADRRAEVTAYDKAKARITLAKWVLIGGIVAAAIAVIVFLPH